MIFGKRINKFYLKYFHYLLLGILALTVVDIGQLKIPEYYRMIVNGINGGSVQVGTQLLPFDMDFLLDHICRPMIFIILLIIVGRFLWRVCFFGSAIRVETDLRDEMFDHCKELSQQYYQVNKVGDLMSLFTNDLETVQDCFGNGVLMLFDAAILGSLAIIKMFRMSVSMTLLCFVPVIIIFILGMQVSKVMNERWEIRQAAFSSLSDFSQESFSGIAVVKAFAKEILEILAFERLNKKNEEVNVSYTKIATFLEVLITLAVESIICIILGYGGFLVYKGQFDAGMLVEFVGYFTSVVWPVMAIAMLVEMSAKGNASLKRISELLDAPVDVKDRPEISADADGGQTSEAAALKGDIEFRDLSFTYPGSSIETLHHLSFHIHAGENIGILGRTGTGKTTIVDLIARIYNVADQTLFVDGKDVNTIPILTLREHIAYVPQDNFLFSDTITNNIAFSLPEASVSSKSPDQVPASLQTSVEEAARMADVHDNILEFPEQYETVLGERGVTVSGGQKQRISIARALMKNAAILILDDSVSAVDTRTERMILDNLKKTRSGMTTLLIAHRISTIEQMDRILFIDDGSLIDFGTHAELLARCPAYADMVARQKLEEERKEN